MKRPFLLISLSLTVLLFASVLAQDQVQIQFQTDPVLAQTGSEAVFTVLTVSNILSMTWTYQGQGSTTPPVTLGLWAGTGPTINAVTQFLGRVTISANQLRISSAQVKDTGNYTVTVIPSATTGLSSSSKAAQLRVFDGVDGINLFVPSVAVENGNVSLSCTLTAGTGITYQWGKGGSAITADSRITISGGSLVINPASRNDAGQYTCTASNPISARTATMNLTVNYGPDTPVLTVDRPKNCVGNGDVLVGQTLRLTCVSTSLPPAFFSWQHNGQAVSSGQPGSGVLSLQTFSTNDSGQYTCAARNSITGGTSQQSSNVAIVDICLSGGEVAGIVIGCFLAIIILVILIMCLVILMRRRTQQQQGNTVVVQKTNPNPRPVSPNPQAVRHLDQGPQPPLYTHGPGRLSRTQHENGSRTQPLNGLHNSNTHQHNGQTQTNRLLNNAIQNTNSDLHNGIDNPAFTNTDAQNANAFLNTQQQQNPNILIQTNTGQGGTQPPAFQVSLNTLPHSAQSNNNAQMPTIHVNLNSFPTNGQQALQDSSLPFTNPANNTALQMQHNPTHTRQSNPTLQSGQPYPNDRQLNAHVSTNHQSQSGPIPTGYTHFNSNAPSQRNANTQTYQQDPESQRRADRNSRRHETSPSSTPRQMPWDLLRRTPAYPSDTFQTTPEFTTDGRSTNHTTGHATRPPLQEARTPNRSQPQSQTPPRRRTPPRYDPPSTDTDTWSHSVDPRHPEPATVTQPEPFHHTQRSPHTQRESAQRDIRDSQNALRRETTRSNNPQALPVMSQQASAGHSVVPQRTTAQQGPAAPQSADTRALADPNHLQQAHMAQQQIAAPVQTPQGPGTHTQPAMHVASQPNLGVTAPAPQPSAQLNSSNLTQAALRAHTERAQVFQNRRQQTQAALHHPGPQQAQASGAGAQRPPTPPPVIPLAQFQALPKNRNQHKSPARGPQPQRNMPAARQHPQAQQRPSHPTAMPTNHHHLPGNAHMHVNAHRHGHIHAHGHGHPAHFTHPRQQQAHRGRPR